MRMMRTLLGDILGADPQVMTTPELVREFVEYKMSCARGESHTSRQRARRDDVVAELRSRGVLD
jgi:hypothetical protein